MQILDPGRGVSDDKVLAFCEANPDLWLQRNARGEIVIVPPVGGETAYRITEVTAEIAGWAKRTDHGSAFGPTVAFLLPDGATFSPRAAWVSDERLAVLSKKERRKFLRVVPEFVVEVMSPSDRLTAAQKKMREWMANGVELSWLIDGDARCIYVYRQGCEMRQMSDIEKIAGEGPVEGFVLELEEIWQGL